MKKIIYLLFTITLITACSSEDSELVNTNSNTISPEEQIVQEKLDMVKTIGKDDLTQFQNTSIPLVQSYVESIRNKFAEFITFEKDYHDNKISLDTFVEKGLLIVDDLGSLQNEIIDINTDGYIFTDFSDTIIKSRNSLIDAINCFTESMLMRLDIAVYEDYSQDPFSLIDEAEEHLIQAQAVLSGLETGYIKSLEDMGKWIKLLFNYLEILIYKV